MIHPQTELRSVNAAIGNGVFATTFIPKGTIVYVKDSLEIEIDDARFQQLDAMTRALAEKYAYIDERGLRIVSWDHSKYVNHRCECNTISTGYGFEIALRDIVPGEEMTDDYGLFNLAEPLRVSCGCANCRKVVLPTDIDRYGNIWDVQVRDALRDVMDVPQPLWDLIDVDTLAALNGYLTGREPYRSVRFLKYEGRTPTAAVPLLKAAG